MAQALPLGMTHDRRNRRCRDRLRRGGDPVTARLRIGILGAARIADEGIIAPARALGHKICSRRHP